MKKAHWGMSLLAIFVSASGFAKEPLPKSMAAIGDSITAGAVAQFSTKSWLNPLEIIGLQFRLIQAKIKDSVEPAQRKDLSWSTGANNYSWVHSHYAMLSYMAEREGQNVVQIFNAAVSQQDSGDALGQLDRVTDWSVTTQSQGAPDYVTVYVGANDLCNDPGLTSTPTETYRKRITNIVHELLTRNKNTKVLLMELPDINRVWEFAGKKKISRWKKLQTCSLLWRTANLCQTVLSDLSPAERQKSISQNMEYNRVLRETANQFSSQSGRYGRDRVRFASGFFDMPLKFEDLSVDCFHPNYHGQSKIGWKSFSQSWWYPEFRGRTDDYSQWVKDVVASRRYKKPKELKAPTRKRLGPPHRL